MNLRHSTEFKSALVSSAWLQWNPLGSLENVHKAVVF